MIQLKAAFAQYYDSDGSPLDGGYVYFGQAGQNPETHPVVVYSDFAATQPIAQPLRTSAGVVVRRGTPIRVYAPLLNYSVTVKNKRGVVIFSALDYAPEANEAVAYTEAIADAAALAAQQSVYNNLAGIENRLDAQDTAISNVAAGYTIRSWATGQSYGPGTVGSTTDTRDVVLVGGVWYIATTDHTAGAVFADDLAAGRWMNTDPVQLRGDLATEGLDKGGGMVAFLSTGGALVSTTVQDAINEVFANTRKLPNIIHNAELRNVFRNNGATPPTTLTANQFLIDRWRAGASGLTRPAATAINGLVTWTAGTLVQELKDFGTGTVGPDSLSNGQKVTFAWGGTAVARINGGAWQTSPFTFESSGTTSSLVLEFGLAGGATSANLLSPRATFGTINPGFSARPLSEVEPLLERYYQRVAVLHQFVAGAGAQTEIWTESHARMATVPTPTYVGSPSYTNTTAATLTTGTNNRFYISMASTAAGNVRVTATVELDTGL
jgi:hypothetical protein